jgi:hypothetical protein
MLCETSQHHQPCSIDERLVDAREGLDSCLSRALALAIEEPSLSPASLRVRRTQPRTGTDHFLLHLNRVDQACLAVTMPIGDFSPRGWYRQLKIQASPSVSEAVW